MNGLVAWAIIVTVFVVFFSIHEIYLYCIQKEPPKLFNDTFEILKAVLLIYTVFIMPLCIITAL